MTTKQLVPISKSELAMPHVVFDWRKKTVNFLEGMEFEEFDTAIQFLLMVEDATPFMIGDALNKGQMIFGEKYSQATKATGKKYDTVLHYCNVAARIPPNERVPGVPFTHHRVLAYLEPDKRKKFLELAAKEDLSVEDLRKRVWNDLETIPNFKCGVCRKVYKEMRKEAVQAYRVCGGCDRKLRKMA